MLDLPPLPEAPVLLVVPDFGVGTARAYAALAEYRARAPLSGGAAWRSPRALGSWSAVAADAVNDFEAVVFDDHHALATVRAQLAALPHTVLAMLSGSGSTLFAVQTGAAASLGAMALPAGWTALKTKTEAQRAIEES